MRERGLLAAVLLLVLGVLVVPAGAATRTIHLTANGPSPAKLALRSGDRVRFVNDDSVPHEVTSTSGWQYDSGPLPPGATSDPGPVLHAPGTYRYTDTRGVVVLPQSFDGALVIPVPPPTPSAAPSATSRPSRSATPTPTASAAPSPPATPPATPSATPSQTPTPVPTAPSASPEPSASPAPSPAPDLRYGDPRALVQSSPHGFGLPFLLGLVAAGGVLSLLVRYLLALAPRRD